MATPTPSLDIVVLIGRWQILQHGHASLLRTALAIAPHVVIVIGSAQHSRDCRNPFTAEERQQQFEAVLSPQERARVTFLPVRDYYDDDRWQDALRAGVERQSRRSDRIGIVGFRKDHTSTYLNHFPGWALHEVEPHWDISSTDLRNIYFEAQDPEKVIAVIGNYVDDAVKEYLRAWAKLPAYRRCATEHRAVKAYREKYTAPFYLTADAVVRANDHVLLVRRGGEIGHGLWALPGGFLEPDERFYDAALRELAEETGFRALDSRMHKARRGETVFDHPLRSARGRIVTTAFYFELSDNHCPEVRASSDAKEARWVPIGELRPLERELFEDHACILDHFLHTFE
jgi:bifunctional NMN adenylyltransferase/nudix hydrolase